MKNLHDSTCATHRSTSLRPQPKAPHSTLSNERCALCVFALLFLAAASALAARDPFWPIGYEPPKPEPVVTEQAEPVKSVKPEVPPKPQPPPIKPISDQDWAAARKAVIVSGFTQSTRPDTGETRTLAMINRRSYAAGDTVCLTNAGIRFLWRVESAASQDLRLTPVEAERVSSVQPPPSDLQKGLE